MDIIPDLLEKTAEYEQELPPPPPAPTPPEGAAIAGWIDHTLLKPEATSEQVKRLCEEARTHHFASVVVNPVYAPLAAGLMAGTQVAVCTVAGFPLGATPTTVKVMEAMASMEAGAREVDMVIHIGALKSEAYGQVLNDVQVLAQVVHNQRAILKVIIETALLTHREKILACLICQAAGADFVKTSTGFGPGGATVEDVDLMYRVVGPAVQVKAAGGIRNYQDALKMISAGATRLGASAGVQIVKEARG